MAARTHARLVISLRDTSDHCQRHSSRGCASWHRRRATCRPQHSQLRYSETAAAGSSSRFLHQLMDDPQEDFPRIARALIQGSREEQRKLIHSLYVADSTFSHPFVDCMSRDEIADAYDYWVHTHRRIDFDYKDADFREGRQFLLIFDFTARFWPYWWPFKRHAYALHYDIKVDLRKHSGKWRVTRQDDTLRLLDTTREVPVLGWIIGDESSIVQRLVTRIIVAYWRINNYLRPEEVSQKHAT